MSALTTYMDRLGSEHLAQGKVKRFRTAIYVFVAVNTLLLALPISSQVWGSESWQMPVPLADSWIDRFVLMLHLPGGEQWHWGLIGLQFLGLGLHFSAKFRRMAALLIYLSTLLLFSRAYLFSIGGHYLVHLMLFYLVFMDEDILPTDRWAPQRLVLSNLFFWAARIQVIIIYLLSGVYKLFGAYWLSGEAVGYMLAIEEWSTPFIMEHLGGVNVLTIGLTYLTLAYLLLFPILVWYRPIKRWLMLFGICFHIGLGWAVGVMDFSIVMIICYLLFWDIGE